MKTIYLFLLSGLLFSAACSQNRTQHFHFTVPDSVYPNSSYNSILCIDAREDTSSMGIIQRGVFNEKVRLLPKPALGEQMTAVLKGCIDSTAQPGQLLILIRQFNFAEITGSFSERGYCYVRAELFAREKDRYRILDRLDSVYVIKAMDVTKATLRKGSEVISSLLIDNLRKEPTDINSYSYEDIVMFDSIEKREMPVYQTEVFTDGLYRNFNSFVNQSPDNKITASLSKKQKLTDVKRISDDGKTEEVDRKDVYAIVFNGIPYISTDYGYYPLQKIKGDFYFTGKAKASANSAEVVTASIFFGLIGGLIASNASAEFEMKIDHRNGGFIRIREAGASK